MLTQTAIYALRIMGYVAANGKDGPVLAQTISDDMNIPRNFMSKIAHKLVQAGLLSSTRGKNGGFVLTRPAKKVTFMNVVSRFMKSDDFGRCFLNLNECTGSCSMHCDWYPIWAKFKKLLNQKTIDKIIPTK